MTRRLTEAFFYGNYFYGICAIGLAIEATLQQRFPLNGLMFYFLMFIITVLYYTYPYVRKSAPTDNARTNWYSRNYNFVFWNQVLISIILLLSLLIFLWRYWNEIWNMPWINWMLILIFPIVASLYYGLDSFERINIRKIGSSKPFTIGFTWAGLVNIYPILLQDIINGVAYEFTLIGVLLFVKNFMFISLLCIMFDIRDYSTDYLGKLKTFAVKIGIRKTISYILVPLAVLGMSTFFIYAFTQKFSPGKVILNAIPFILLIIAAWSLRRPRSIMYYLVVIDGLMLVKAIFGTIAISYF